MTRLARVFASAVALTAVSVSGFSVSQAGASVPARAPAPKAVEYVGVVKGVKPYVGDVPQQDAYFVAIAVDKSKSVVAYTCDGFGGSASFTGTEQRGKVDLASQDGQAQITATITSSSAKGRLTLGGEAYSFTLKKAKTVGGLYTIAVSQSGDGAITATGTSERGNKLTTTGKPDEQKYTVTVTPVNGSKRKLVATPLQPPEQLLGFDSYRFVLLDTGKMGRGNPTLMATQLPPLTPVTVTTAQRLTGTILLFF
jgi:hypothetical protein